MRSRIQKIARMVAVQRQMHRLEEWKLVLLQRREDELREEERSLISSLNGDEPLHGLFVEAMAKRLTAIGKEASVVGKAKETQTKIVLTENRKLRHVERMEATATTSAERAGEKRRLEEVIGEAILRIAARPASGRRGH